MSERLYAVCECGQRGLLAKNFGAPGDWSMWPGERTSGVVHNNEELQEVLANPNSFTKTGPSGEEYLFALAEHIRETGHTIQLELET